MAGRTLLFLLTFCGVALADDATAHDTLYARLGGGANVSAFVDDAAADLGDAKHQLETRICALAGGGCRATQDALALSDAQFVTLLEQLRASMRAHGVPLAARNELLEVLAPMRRDLARR